MNQVQISQGPRSRWPRDPTSARSQLPTRRRAGVAMVRLINVTVDGVEWEEEGDGRFYSGNGESSIAVVTITILQTTVASSMACKISLHTCTKHVITKRPIFIGSNLQWSAKGISTCGYVLEGARRHHGTLPPLGLGYARHKSGMLEIYLQRRERMEPSLILQTEASRPGKGNEIRNPGNRMGWAARPY